MFVVCGEALIDVFVEKNAQAPSEQFPLQACVGGSPFNVAIGLARLAQPVALMTGLSDDMFGKRLSKVLATEGVSQQLIVKKQLPTTVAFVEKDQEGVPSYSFYGEGTADRSLQIDDIDLQMPTPTAIHLGSYSIVSQPTADSLLALVKKFTGKCLISLDPNIRSVVEPDMKIWRNRVKVLVDFADMVKVSDEDLALMYPNTKPESIIEEWLSTGLKLIVLTRGGAGSSLWSSQAQINIEAPNVKVVDTVGAGDTYQAALLDFIGEMVKQFGENWHHELTQEVLKEVGQYAAKAAAITCSRQGADLPTKVEINAFT